MTNIEKIKQLAGAVDTDLQEEVESVIINAGKYVAAVTTMECASLNLQNRKGEDYRSAVSRTDAARSRAHNAFYRCCQFCQQTGRLLRCRKNLHRRSRTPRLRRFCLCHRERNL